MEVRIQLSETTNEMLEEMCKKLGVKKAELGKLALLEYLKEFYLFSQKINEDGT